MMNGGWTTGRAKGAVARLAGGIAGVRPGRLQMPGAAFPIPRLSFRTAIAPFGASIASLCFFLLTLPFLFSCGTRSGQFKIEGRFRNLNSGEFYVYSSELPSRGLDTIKVSDGRFSYVVPLEGKATFIILFPNFSEQAVFGESGAKVSISGDASHLKEMEIKGTKDNELMTKFRQSANRMSPPEETEAAGKFIKEHPDSPVSLYLLQKYFIRSERPDYPKAVSLLAFMIEKMPDNGWLTALKKRLDVLGKAPVGGRIPSFSALDTNGKQAGNISLKAKVNIINVWASWSYDSQNLQRTVAKLKKKHGDDIAVLGICLDGRADDCRKVMERDSVKWPVVCDEKMWQSPLVARLGIGRVPSSVVFDRNGKVLARDLRQQNLTDKVEELLK